MALKTFVKVSEVTNLSDARYCAGMEVNLLGFNLIESHHAFMPLDKYKEITEWLSGVEYVAEVDGASVSEISEIVSQYAPNYIQITDSGIAEELKQYDLPIILEAKLNDISSINADNFELILIKNESDAALSNEEIQMIKGCGFAAKLLIGSGITEKNVEELIKETGAKGIALTGSAELRPGYKDYDELADILEVLEDDPFI